MTTLGEKAVALAQGLIRCPSVTPKDAGALDVLIEPLKKARFVCDRLTFTEEGTPAIDNLVARIGDGPPHLCFCRAYRRGAAGRRDIVETSTVCCGDRRRRALRPRRLRHEGGDRLLCRRGDGLCQGKEPGDRRYDQPAHHRRRGRPLRQRHEEGAQVDGAAGPQARSLHRGRAVELHAARRDRQDRPARQPERAAEGDRPTRPCRLPASRGEPGQRHRHRVGEALRHAARLRQRTLLAVQPRSDQHRRRQSGDQRDPSGGRGQVQRPLQ